MLREAPLDGALVLGARPRGRLQGHGKAGAFTRVELDANRSAFVAPAEVKPGGTARGVRARVARDPAGPDGEGAHGGQRQHGAHQGPATDDQEVKDVYVRVWNRDSKMPPKKVFYLPNRGDQEQALVRGRRAAVAGEQPGAGVRA